jgi:hypothetical protein
MLNGDRKSRTEKQQNSTVTQEKVSVWPLESVEVWEDEMMVCILLYIAMPIDVQKTNEVAVLL